MFTRVVNFFAHQLVQAVLATAVVIFTINTAMAAEKPTIGEVMEKYVEEQNATDSVADLDRLRSNFLLCRFLLGQEGDCSQEWEAFKKVLDQQ